MSHRLAVMDARPGRPDRHARRGLRAAGDGVRRRLPRRRQPARRRRPRRRATGAARCASADFRLVASGDRSRRSGARSSSAPSGCASSPASADGAELPAGDGRAGRLRRRRPPRSHVRLPTGESVQALVTNHERAARLAGRHAGRPCHRARRRPPSARLARPGRADAERLRMSRRAKSSTAEPRLAAAEHAQGDDGEHEGDHRADQHRRRQRVERRRRRAADGGVDLDRHGLARGVGRQERRDHEVVDRRGEHDHQAGEDRRPEQRQQHRAQRLQRRGAEVAGGLLERRGRSSAAGRAR